jgi:hypothetical protein
MNNDNADQGWVIGVDRHPSLGKIEESMKEQLCETWALHGDPDGEYPGEYIIDNQGRPRRWSLRIELSPPDEPGTREYSLTRTETIGANYRVQARSLNEAVRRLEMWEELFIIREEDDDYVTFGALLTIAVNAEGEVDWVDPEEVDGEDFIEWVDPGQARREWAEPPQRKRERR